MWYLKGSPWLLYLVSTIGGFFIWVLWYMFMYFREKYLFWKKRGVPFKKPHWLLGSFVDSFNGKISIGQDVTNFYREFAEEPFFGTWEFHSPTLIARDPKLLHDIFNTNFATWSSRGIAVNADVDPLAAHLVNQDGKRWEVTRKTLGHAFTPAKLKAMGPKLFECGQHFDGYLIRIAAMNESAEARDLSAQFTTDAIGACIFGIRTNSLNNDNAEFRKIGKKIFENSAHKRRLRVIQKSMPGLFKLFKLSKHSKQLTDFFLKITRETIDSRRNNNGDCADFMDKLISLKNKDSEHGLEFKDEHLAAQIYGFFGAGFETSATTIGYCLHELAANSDIQAKLRSEIEMQKQLDGGEITWSGLQQMKYLDMVVQETLRKYPPVPIISRRANQAYKIPNSDIELPAGTGLIAPVYAIHHDSEYYPNPEKFDPLRFTDEAKARRPTCAFLPFGAGPRYCIGSRFADQQMKLAIVKIVDRFLINLCEKSTNPLQIEPSVRFLVPKDGIWIRILPLS